MRRRRGRLTPGEENVRTWRRPASKRRRASRSARLVDFIFGPDSWHPAMEDCSSIVDSKLAYADLQTVGEAQGRARWEVPGQSAKSGPPARVCRQCTRG